MAQRFLALDWDQNQLHVVAATVSGGTVKVTRALLLEDMGTPSRAQAQQLGKLLRDRLKEFNVALAPVIVCIGRDKLILKEIRFPAVPLHEEAGIVRFQVVKELTESADESVIDYCTLPNGNTIGERNAQVFIVKKQLIEGFQQICQVAGLKLAGLVPRAHGMAACLRSLMGTSVLVPPPEPADAAVALVTVGEKWAECAILKGGTLVQARALTLGPALAGEIRRSLAVYSAQQSQTPVKAVYLALSGEQAALREKLVQSLDMPVHPFDPFAGAEGKELPSSGRGTFVGAVGLLKLMARGGKLPINFAEIKQVRPPQDPNRRLYVLVAALLLVLVGVGLAVSVLENKKRQKGLREQETELADLTKQLADEREKRARMQALFDWEQVCWPDEVYELTRAMPPASKTFRVRKLEGLPDKPTGNTTALATQKQVGPPPIEDLNAKPIARLFMELTAPGDKELNDLGAELLKSGDDKLGTFYRPEAHDLNRGVYKKDVKIRRRPPEAFKENMTKK